MLINNIDSKYLIYALIDPRTNEIRYIGKSITGLTRPKYHKYTFLKENTYKANWLKNLYKSGKEYKILVLEYLESKDQLNDKEIFYISMYKSLGAPLTNLTIGGDGTNGKPQTEKQKKATIESNKKRGVTTKQLEVFKYYNNLRKLGIIKTSQKNIDRFREYAKNRKYTIEEREKHSLILGGKPFICVETGEKFISRSIAAEKLGLKTEHIYRVLYGKRKSTGGYTFKFEDNK